MGTEILPKFLVLLKVIVAGVGIFSLLIILVASAEYRLHKGNKTKQREMKSHILMSIIAFLIVLIVYFLFAAIGPAFRFLFVS